MSRLAAALLLGLLAPVLAQDRPRFNHTYVRDDDPTTAGLVQEALRAADEGDAEQTAERLQALLLGDVKGVVAVSGKELFVGARRWAQIRLLGERPPFGPGVLEAWRAAHDAEVNAELRGALAAGNEDEALRILDRAPAATDAPAILIALADRALLRGDPDAAYGFLLRLPEHIAPSAEKAWLESAGYRRRVAYLEALPDRGSVGWPTPGGDATRARNGDPLPEPDGLKRLWETPFLTQDPYVFGPPPDEDNREYSLVVPFYPVCDEERLYVHLGATVAALDRRSGKLLFFAPAGAGGDRDEHDRVEEMMRVTPGVRAATVAGGVLYFNRLVFDPVRPRAFNQIVAFDVANRRDLWAVRTGMMARGGPAILRRKVFFRGAPAVRGDRLYVYGAVRAEGEDGPTRKEEAYLFCFDRLDGTLLWHRFLAYGDTDAAPRMPPLSGAAPAAAAGVVVAVSGLGVAAALDARTGDVLWLFRYDRQPIRVRQRLSDWSEDEKVHLRSAWKREPPRIVKDAVYLAPFDSDDAYACWLRGARSPIVGYTLVKWDRPRTRVWGHALLEYVGGIVDGRIYYVGRRHVRQGPHLTYQSVLTHRVHGDHETAGYGRIPPERRAKDAPVAVPPEVYGRPTIAGTTLLVPTARAVFRFDAGVSPPTAPVDGERVHEIPLLATYRAPQATVGEGEETPPSFGTLVAIDGFLYAVTADRVICYGPGGD